MRFKVLARLFGGLLLIASLPLVAQDSFVLVTTPAKVQDVCGRHGLTQVTQVSRRGVFLVSSFSVDPRYRHGSGRTKFRAQPGAGRPRAFRGHECQPDTVHHIDS